MYKIFVKRSADLINSSDKVLRAGFHVWVYTCKQIIVIDMIWNKLLYE